MKVRSGVETLVEQNLSLVRGRRVGLVTNHSAVNRNLVHAIEVLKGSGVNLVALYGPEHGVRGDIPDGQPAPSFTDPRTGLVAHSLYGQARKPTREMLAGVEVVLFDIQDIGCRFYTYVYTMAYVMQACAEYQKQFIVLDRPNPVNGLAIEGNVLDTRFASFVGLYPICIRHGMTAGELALFFNGQFAIGADVEVANCQAWKRSMWFDETGLPWVMPSPNVPSPETAALYPGLCLIEGTNVSEARGTTKPFEMFGAPWVDAYELAERLNAGDLPGIRFRPAHFIPTASKYQGERCGGVQAHVMDRDSLNAVAVGVYAIKALHDLYPKEFQFRPPGASGKCYFDLLAGTDKTRLAIEAGVPADEIIESWRDELCSFNRDRQAYLLYS
ncbi:MAG TPA: DUF1343 domain-containing protein [Armatimonadota bacterium]|nr:DUF1343 domain-containing protein [Armatimonadota bacterium]